MTEANERQQQQNLLGKYPKIAPWKKSYDKPRQHIKKQRYHFTDKGLYRQKYGFSGSHVWM